MKRPLFITGRTLATNHGPYNYPRCPHCTAGHHTTFRTSSIQIDGNTVTTTARATCPKTNKKIVLEQQARHFEYETLLYIEIRPGENP